MAKNSTLEKIAVHAKTIGFIVASFLAYYISARLGLEVATINKQTSAVWPATGIGISLVYLFGPRMAIGIFAGAFLANFETGLNIPANLVISFGNSLESLLAVWFFNRYMSQQSVYGIYSKAIFGLVIVTIGSAVSAFFGTIALWASSTIPTHLVLKNWIIWSMGDFIGALFLVPIAYKIKNSKFDSLKIQRSQIWKFVIVVIFTAALSRFIFNYELGKPFLFLIFLSMLLAANWLDSVWVYFVSLAVCVYAVQQTLGVHGPFAENIQNTGFIHLQIFLAALGITALGVSSLKEEDTLLLLRPNLALLFCWTLSGIAFYFSYSSAALKDDNHFSNTASLSRKAIEVQMSDYIRLLESGVSFFAASDFVSQREWHLFTNKFLETDYYPGIQGLGILFSTSIEDRFKNSASPVIRYQPDIKIFPVPNVSEEMQIKTPEDGFVLTYVEPMEGNRAAIGINISNEKHRYEAAIRARDTGLPAMSEEITIQKDGEGKTGFLIFAPIYKNGLSPDTIKGRRAAFIGFVSEAIIFENFMKAAVASFEQEVSLKVFTISKDGVKREVYSTSYWPTDPSGEKNETVVFAGKAMNLMWRKGHDFELSTILVSSWIAFFGTLISLFVAIMLSSLENLKTRAQRIAEAMTKEVNEKRRLWQALTETSPAGIFMTDKEGLCTYVNSAWTQMSGLTMDQARGEGWVKALHPEDLLKVMSGWGLLIQGKNFLCNYRFIHSDNTIVHVTGQARPLMDENFEITGYFGTIQDITELRENQMTLLTSSRMSSLGEMAAGIAHEINNPLAIIQGKALYLELLIDSDQAPDQVKMKANIKQIYLTVQRIAKIIKGLQTFSRDTSGEPFNKCFIKDALEDTLEMCRERFSSNKVELITPAEIGRELCFMGRTDQIAQVLLNLINNAFDAAYKMKDKWVRVEVKRNQDKINILIVDSGSGIAPADQNKIFDPFFTTKDVGKGTGLGLSISRGIVDRHGGRLLLDTTKTQTTFIIELPLYFEIPEKV